MTSFSLWPELLPELQGEVVARLDPASRQCLSWTSRGAHTQWRDPELVRWHALALLPTQQIFLTQASLWHLTQFLPCVPWYNELSLIAPYFVSDRPVEDLRFLMAYMTGVADPNERNAIILKALILLRRTDDIEHLAPNSTVQYRLLRYAAYVGNVDYLLKYLSSPVYADFIGLLMMSKYPVNWEKLLAVQVWSTGFHGVIEHYYCMNSYRGHTPQLPHVWAYLTPEHQAILATLYDPETGRMR
jgi:hypothetical protein